MKNPRKQLIRWAWMLMVCAPLIGGVACSDGQMSKRPVEVPLPDTSPAINSFTVQDAKTAGAPAGKTAEIDEGGSVFLVWDVANAKEVEIVYVTSHRKVEGVSGLKGKTTTEALKADETFVLTATGTDGKTLQEKVTVKVRKREIKINFVARPKEIRSGEKSDLCWQITGADPKAKVAVVDGAQKEVYPGTAMPEAQPADKPPAPAAASVQKMLLAVIPPPPPADGYGSKPPATEGDKDKPKEEPKKEEAKETCISVTPNKTTTYTLTVRDGDKTASQEAKIEVMPAPAQMDISFTVQPTQLTGPGEVTLIWHVTPADVKIEIDHNVTKGDKADGEKKVPVAETTTFTLTATTQDSQSQSAYVTVPVGRVAGSRPTAQLLTPFVFSGEPVRIAVSSDNPAAKFSVRDPRGNTPKFTVEGGVMTITNPVDGSYTVDADGSPANTVEIEVREFDVKMTGSWNGLGIKGFKVVLAGNTAPSSSGIGMIRMLGMDVAASIKPTFGRDKEGKEILYGTKLGEILRIHAEYLDKTFTPFTANSFAFGQESGRTYAAVTGAVLYSKNLGIDWQFLDPFPLFDGSGKYKDVSESHPGCLGIKQQGGKNMGSGSATNPLVNINDVCDVVVMQVGEKEKLFVATDYGVYYYNDVAGRIADGKNDNKDYFIQGHTEDNVLYGKVVSKLAVTKVGEQVVLLAAASDGVYVNTQNGDSKAWQQIDKANMKDAVNTVAVSGNTIYAGTDKGLFKYDGLNADGKWTEVDLVGQQTDPEHVPPAPGDKAAIVAVKALAVDAADPTILYVGTNKGLKIGRCGASFTDIAASVGSVRNIATAAEGGRSAVVLTSDKGLFSSVGVAGSPGSKSCSAPTPQAAGDKPTTTGPGTVVPK